MIFIFFSAFFWLLSLLFSSILWFAVVPLREKLAFGLVFSIIFQELFRYGIYALLAKADAYLKKLTENESTMIFANRHILAYGKNFWKYRPKHYNYTRWGFQHRNDKIVASRVCSTFFYAMKYVVKATTIKLLNN